MLAAVILPVVFSCNQNEIQADANGTQNENVLRYDINFPVKAFKPVRTNPSGSSLIFPLLYSYLFVPDENGKLQPDLAHTWSFDEKKKVWTIQLKKNAKFHNNRPVTAKDIKYTIEKQIKLIHQGLDSVIDQIILLSPTTLSIHLKKEDRFILDKIWSFEIIPHADRGRIDYYNNPIGSGPFRFKSRKDEKQVILEANDYYYGGRPFLDQIIFSYQPDREKAWTRLIAGETDIAQEISPKNHEIMTPIMDKFYVEKYILNFYTILLYNTFDPLFSDPQVRMALTLAIDRKRIVKDILMGKGVVANGAMGVNSPYHNPDVIPLPCNLQKARTLLKEAGWKYDQKQKRLFKKGTPFEFTIFLFKESQVEKEVARYIQLCLNEIGIKANLKLLSFDKLMKKYIGNTNFQAVLTEFNGSYRNPEFLLSLWSSGLNRTSDAGGFDHPEITRLIQTALNEKSSLNQMALFHKIDSLIASLQPGTFLFQKTAFDAMSKRFRLPFPFNLEHEGIYRLRYASLAPR